MNVYIKSFLMKCLYKITIYSQGEKNGYQSINLHAYFLFFAHSINLNACVLPLLIECFVLLWIEQVGHNFFHYYVQ